jgi:hypothetical protein
VGRYRCCWSPKRDGRSAAELAKQQLLPLVRTLGGETVVAHPEHVAEPAPAGAPQLLLNRLHRTQRVELGIDELGLLCCGAARPRRGDRLRRGPVPAVGAAATGAAATRAATAIAAAMGDTRQRARPRMCRRCWRCTSSSRWSCAGVGAQACEPWRSTELTRTL